MASPAPVVLFDLDGTLIDSAPGIFATLAHAFAQVGAELPPHEVLRGWIGPPFRQTFPHVLGDDAVRIEAAIEHYRLRFEESGWREHTLYPGIECPPQRTARGRSVARAFAIAAATPAADRGRAISAGRRSCMAFHTARAAS